MEYLVTMTTQVPDGTPPQEVDAVRTREADHSRELAAQGRLLRLWRPPLGPGEWRTLGLFAAATRQAGGDLASMPLRVWRPDEPAASRVHPNDPGRAAGHRLRVPDGVQRARAGPPPGQAVEEIKAGEAEGAKELASRETCGGCGRCGSRDEPGPVAGRRPGRCTRSSRSLPLNPG